MVHEKVAWREELTLPQQPHALAIGDEAPSFQGLLGVDGKVYSLSSFDDKKVLIIIFMAKRCTTKLAYTERIEAIHSDYLDSGAQIVAINSDNPDLLPTDSCPDMVRVAKERGYSFPYFKDEDRTVAQDYGAILTLHAFLLDQNRRVKISREDRRLAPAGLHDDQRPQECAGRRSGRKIGQSAGDQPVRVRHRCFRVVPFMREPSRPLM